MITYLLLLITSFAFIAVGYGTVLRDSHLRGQSSNLTQSIANHIDLQGQSNCLGAPYIYITLHDAANIYKYSRDGCLLDDDVLDYVSFVQRGYVELRSMALGKYHGEEMLYIVDAISGDSRIMIYGSCDDRGKRAYVTTAQSTQDNPGIDHTYGICFDKEDNLYISNQHTDNVMRFFKDNFRPMPFPPALANDPARFYMYKGTYKQFGSPTIHSPDEQGVRSIIIVHDEMWITNEDFDGVVVVNLQSGISTNVIVIPKPIGLFYDSITKLVYVTSKGKHRQGHVYGIDKNTLKITKIFKQDRMEHPTGVFVYGNILYVAEQIESAVLTFDIDTGKYIDKVIKHVPGDIEHMILSDC